MSEPSSQPLNTTNHARQTAGIVLIGNELLSGQTADKNMNYIAKKLFGHGVDLRECSVVPDVETDMIRVITDFSQRFDYVFTTGGIGPTHDDITAMTLAKAFGREFERHQEAFEILKAKYGEANLTDSRGRMTMMPRGVELIYNTATAAPGFRIENVYVMAGIPHIMQTMMDHALTMIPQGPPRLKAIVLVKIYESKIAAGLHDIQDRFPHIEIGSYPHWKEGQPWGVRVAITASNQDNFQETVDAVLTLCQEYDNNAHVSLEDE